MCIKSTTYLRQKCANWVLKMMLFYALVLMLLINLAPKIAHLKDAVLAASF